MPVTTLRLYDKQYRLIAEKMMEPLIPGVHRARFIHETFAAPAVQAQAQEMEGILVIISDQPVHVAGSSLASGSRWSGECPTVLGPAGPAAGKLPPHARFPVSIWQPWSIPDT
jgi:hypothetical protein